MVAAYSVEAGLHLEVVNFKNGDGAVTCLFVVTAGRYDVQTRTTIRPAVDVLLDRTRLWLVL